MKLPSSSRTLPCGLACPQADIEPAVWQAHLLKHPMGFGSLISYSGQRPWNAEGWDRLEPPVITESRREALVKAIASLAGCRFPEIRGGTGSDPDELPCYQCPGKSLAECQRLLGTGEPLVGKGYADVALSMIESLSSDTAIAVDRAAVCQRAISLWRTPEALTGLTVASAGLDHKDRPILRASRYDGVRTEFYLRGSEVRWRTTYRELRATAPRRLVFLLDMNPPSVRAGTLSDRCIVPRQWWENHED